MDVSGHIAEIGGDIAFDQRAEEFPALMIDLIDDPDSSGDGEPAV